jgi:ER membrane protein complex subunit 2
MSKQADAISAMVELLDAFPTSTEAWCELADLYLEQGMCAQAIFSLEEALLITPNSWNVSSDLAYMLLYIAFSKLNGNATKLHARLGELLYITVNSSPAQGSSLGLLARAVKHFCRSIELCTDYLRGFYGLKLV